MGFPILGDPQYGTEESVALSEKLGLTGQLLCAKALEFHHPMTDQPLRVESRLEVNIWEELK
jgi:23S rRNA-/tRNA-specific pseudouridylate synthase